MDRFAIVVIGLLFCCPGHAEPAPRKSEAKPHPLVTAHVGDLPILLSAPHGGRQDVPGVPRRQGKGVKQFRTQSDTDTDRLAGDIADAIAEITGKRPYVVIARFHRKFIDANRAPGSAYEAEQAKPVYDAYQRSLAEARREIIDRWGRGILLDIHGQALAPDTIYRGTRNGETTAHLTKRFGKDALTGGKSLFGQLAKQGFKVEPPADSPGKETHYTGGHIVNTCGSASGGTFDAIQLELGKGLRSASQRTQTTRMMARAISAFANDYLPKEEIAGNAKTQPPPPGKVRVGVYP